MLLKTLPKGSRFLAGAWAAGCETLGSKATICCEMYRFVGNQAIRISFLGGISQSFEAQPLARSE